jgi:hypothetical protein
MVRAKFSAIAFVLLASSAGAAMAQLPRSRGPADPRYYPDLYKGPAWGMTLSEYYTFGNKADGPYGYALSGYRYGSHDDITRWKQATGTALPPGYYWQRLRERRGVQPAAATPLTAEPAPVLVEQRPVQSSRRNAQERGLKLENSPQSTNLTGPDQSDVSLLGSNKIRRIPSTDAASGDDKN